MEKVFENENTCDIFMNEIKMEDEPLLEAEENGSCQENESLQTKGNRIPRMNKEKMEDNFKKLHAQRSFWKGNLLC
jgi:hypothetical protein